MNTAVERMMEEYGVRGSTVCAELKKQGFPHCGNCPIINPDSCDRIANYPPFTAEKQIELIKLLAEYNFSKDVSIVLALTNCSGKYHFERNINIWDESPCYSSDIEVCNFDFTEGLAEFLIKAKPYLDTAKVKEILK